MSVRRYKKDQWMLDIKIGAERIRRVVRCSKSDALKQEARIRAEFKASLAERHGLEEGLLRYLTDYVPHLKDFKGQTNKAKHLRPYLINKSFPDVPDIVSELKKLPLKPATINRRLALLRRICTLAYKEWGWLNNPVGQKISLLPENNERHVYLDMETVKQLANACQDNANRDAVLIAAYTGLRRSEIFKAEKRENLLIVENTKSGLPRIIPLHPDIQDIEMPLKTTDALLRKDFVNARDAIERKDIRFHDLRHTFASFLVAKGVDLRTVGELLGHSQAQTTKRYTHLSVENLKTAVDKI